MAGPLPLWIDTDNALGSRSGDIDDAFALLALLSSGLPILGISATFGNCPAVESLRNTRALAALLHSHVQNQRANGTPVIPGAASATDSSVDLCEHLSRISIPFRFAALGPLTGLARALEQHPSIKRNLREVIVIGLNLNIPFPTARFFDFNLSRDLPSAKFVLQSNVNLAVIPCDQARRVRLGEADLARLPTPYQNHFIEHARRWFRRARFLKNAKSIPVWDLVAAMYLLKPELFEVSQTQVIFQPGWGFVLRPRSDGSVKVVSGFNPNQVISSFWELFDSTPASSRSLDSSPDDFVPKSTQV